MIKPINKSAILSIASVSQNLVDLLSLARAFNKIAVFESEYQSGSQFAAYRLFASIVNIIINVMPMPVKPMAIKWHRLASRPVGKVNI